MFVVRKSQTELKMGLCVGIDESKAEAIEAATPIEHLIRVRDAFEAIDLCLTTDFDLIISEQKMPEMNGDELVHRLNNANYHPSVPAVLVDGNECTAFAQRPADRAVSKLAEGCVKQAINRGPRPTFGV